MAESDPDPPVEAPPATTPSFQPLAMFADLPDDHLLTPKEVAAAYRVHPKTPGRWNDEQGLTAIRAPGGRRRFPLGELRRWQAEQDRLYGHLND